MLVVGEGRLMTGSAANGPPPTPICPNADPGLDCKPSAPGKLVVLKAGETVPPPKLLPKAGEVVLWLPTARGEGALKLAPGAEDTDPKTLGGVGALAFPKLACSEPFS